MRLTDEINIFIIQVSVKNLWTHMSVKSYQQLQVDFLIQRNIRKNLKKNIESTFIRIIFAKIWLLGCKNLFFLFLIITNFAI